MVRNPNDGSAIVTADLTNITVKFDADTAELVFRDSAGRAMGFGYAGSARLDNAYRTNFSGSNWTI